MKKPVQQMLGSFLSILILGLILIVPFWISNELEEIETAQSGLIPFQSIRSSSTIQWNNTTGTTTYIPYWESNSTNEGQLYWSNMNVQGPAHAVIYNIMADEFSYTFNANGYYDLYYLTSYSTGGSCTLNLYFQLTFQDLIDDNADEISIWINSPLNYNIGTISAMGTDASHNNVANQIWNDKPSSWDTTVSGENHFQTTLDTTFLNGGASAQTSGVNDIFRLTIDLPDGYEGENIFIDVQVSPQYYEEIEGGESSSYTVWNNETITTYEPYIQTYSNPSLWTKISLWINGILLVGVAIVITPFFNFSKFNFNLKKKPRRKRR